ncbi:hypothetical protein BDA99DRAFT_565120 [Phascolomyces articulosus]|uniref:Orn/DAP/Arg decarboxylase 2 N-terminal domain-containing protein n=1 Tax=Phascolomyces articulosus TaxID=60185 RepID=A0AAD5JYW9_9FUNG|nr:hypothetical protein BDA99DRAFT_565120 [Phascolomyces articulosus]
MVLNIVGVSFYVGSSCINEAALRDTRAVFDYATTYGYHFTLLLSTGGGFQ